MVASRSLYLAFTVLLLGSAFAYPVDPSEDSGRVDNPPSTQGADTPSANAPVTRSFPAPPSSNVSHQSTSTEEKNNMLPPKAVFTPDTAFRQLGDRRDRQFNNDRFNGPSNGRGKDLFGTLDDRMTRINMGTFGFGRGPETPKNTGSSNTGPKSTANIASTWRSALGGPKTSSNTGSSNTGPSDNFNRPHQPKGLPGQQKSSKTGANTKRW